MRRHLYLALFLDAIAIAMMSILAALNCTWAFGLGNPFWWFTAAIAGLSALRNGYMVLRGSK